MESIVDTESKYSRPPPSNSRNGNHLLIRGIPDPLSVWGRESGCLFSILHSSILKNARKEDDGMCEGFCKNWSHKIRVINGRRYQKKKL